MNRKKFWMAIVLFIVYCILLVLISVNNKNIQQAVTEIGNSTDNAVKNTDRNTVDNSKNSNNTHEQRSLIAPVDLISLDAFAYASIDGKADVDTPWKSNIVLLGADDAEQGLLMLPGTAITYTVQMPSIQEESVEAKQDKLTISAKLFDTLAEAGVSDGVTLVVEVLQDGTSLMTYDQIGVSGNGQVTDTVLDLSEWQGRVVQIRVRCYDGGNDNADGDWCVIKELKIFAE